RAVEDEIRFHVDMKSRELASSGLSEEAARAEALRRFGDVERTRANLEAIDRERAEKVRRLEWTSGVLQDLRLTLRGLRARPAFTAVVVLTLALGVGANTTMFGIVDRLLMRPPALLRDPARVNLVYLGRTFDGQETFTPNMSYKRYEEF